MAMRQLVLHRPYLMARLLTLLYGLAVTAGLLSAYVHDAPIRRRLYTCLEERRKEIRDEPRFPSAGEISNCEPGEDDCVDLVAIEGAGMQGGEIFWDESWAKKCQAHEKDWHVFADDSWGTTWVGLREDDFQPKWDGRHLGGIAISWVPLLALLGRHRWFRKPTGPLKSRAA